MTKIDSAIKLISEYLDKSTNPVCCCSFGKDSLVMLDLIRKVEKIPIIFWREPFFQKKFEFANKIIQDWNLTVYDYPPTIVDYCQEKSFFEVCNFYYISPNVTVNLVTGIRKRGEDKDYLCALVDLLGRPKVPCVEFKWDTIFHGAKNGDTHGFIVERPKESVIVKDKTFVYPLYNWSDKDIWTYIRKNDLPYNHKRYDIGDDNSNNDIYPCCYDCLDYHNIGKEIVCPNSGDKMTCVAKTKEESGKMIEYLKQVNPTR